MGGMGPVPFLPQQPAAFHRAGELFMTQTTQPSSEATAVAYIPDEDTVLIVDDAPLDRRVVEQLLEDKGWRGGTAGNGAAGLESPRNGRARGRLDHPPMAGSGR